MSSLQPSRWEYTALKNVKFLIIFLFCPLILAFLDPNPRDQLNRDPQHYYTLINDVVEKNRLNPNFLLNSYLRFPRYQYGTSTCQFLAVRDFV
jgi:hypothetical protein